MGDALERPDLITMGPPRCANRILPLLILTTVLVAAAPARAGTPPDCPAAADAERVLLVPRVNGQLADFCAFALTLDGRVYLPQRDLQRLRLRLPESAPLIRDGTPHHPLDAIAELTYHVDEPHQELHISGPASIFQPHRVQHTPRRHPPSPSPGGVFLNYDLHAQQRDSGRVHTSGLFETRLFGAGGSGGGTWLLRDRGDDREWLRLETEWTVDRPERRQRLRIGDGITRPGAWGSAMRFGGLQWGTDFSLDPYFSTTAAPIVAGETPLPSTLELFVNDRLALRRDVPPGPFEIRDPPVVTGQGEMQLVIRDLLGREQMVTRPYHASPRLLKAGLTDHHLALGTLRRDYSRASNRYGSGFGTGLVRHGVSPTLTAEGRAEIAEDQQTGGLALSHLLLNWAVLDLTLAVSRSDAGNGRRAGLGLLRQARPYSLGLRLTHTDRDYTQLGAPPGTLPRYQGRAHARRSFGQHGSWGVSALYREPRVGRALRAFTLSHRRRLGDHTALSISVTRTELDTRDHSLLVSLTRSLGHRTSGRAYYTRRDEDHRQGVSLQRNPPPGTGIGWRMLAEDGPNERLEASMRGQTEATAFNAAAARRGGITAYRAGLRGGFAYMDGGVFASRHIDDGFAVVRTGEYPKVGIYRNNHLVARSNRHAMALVPRLRAYEANRLAVDLDDLPLEARIDSPEVTVVPRRRSGVLADFDIEPAHGALIQLVDEEGLPLPAGSTVQFADRDERFPVAHNGWTYVTGLKDTARLIARWPGRACTVEVTRPTDAGPQPRIGPVTCKGSPTE